jgi:hypothetical protein
MVRLTPAVRDKQMIRRNGDAARTRSSELSAPVRDPSDWPA